MTDFAARSDEIVCPHCRSNVPAGAFCGSCGQQLVPKRGWSNRLRLNAFISAPGENILWPAVTSSLFPRLARRSRRQFRIATALVIALVLGLALMRLTVPLIAVGALWFWMLVLVYLKESDAIQRFSARRLIVVGLLGAGLGVGWMTATSQLIAHVYDIPIATSLAIRHELREGILMPVGSMVLMGLPAVLARLTLRGKRQCLDGLTLGTLGVASFNAFATMTRYAPQFAGGLLQRDRPVLGLVVEAGINGIALPLTGATTGGLVGVVLWYSNTGNPIFSRRIRGYLIVLTVVTFGIFFIERIIDIRRAPEVPTLIVHAVLTTIALIVLRIGLQLALLTESHEVASPEPVLCIQCECVVSGMAFCSNCGALLSYPAPTVVRPPGLVRIAIPMVAITTMAVVALSLSATLVAQKTPYYECPPDCGQPLMGTPVADNPRYTAPNGDFSVSYPSPDSAYRITMNDHGVTAEFTAGDTGIMQLFSHPAGGRSAQEIVNTMLQQRFAGAETAYEIPNAMVGYEPGYGLVADYWPVNGVYSRVRIVLLAAVKNDLALLAGAGGPYRAYGPDFGPGKPAGVNLEIALDMGQYVNSFTWKGDPPR